MVKKVFALMMILIAGFCHADPFPVNDENQPTKQINDVRLTHKYDVIRTDAEEAKVIAEANKQIRHENIKYAFVYIGLVIAFLVIGTALAGLFSLLLNMKVDDIGELLFPILMIGVLIISFLLPMAFMPSDEELAARHGIIRNVIIEK